MNGGVETALVVSTTSDIGGAIAHRRVKDGYALQFVARDAARLESYRNRGIHGIAVTACGNGTASCRDPSQRDYLQRSVPLNIGTIRGGHR